MVATRSPRLFARAPILRVQVIGALATRRAARRSQAGGAATQEAGGTFDFLNGVINLDVSSMGSCLVPLDYTQRYYSITVAVPLLLAASLLSGALIWNGLRSLPCLRSPWAAMLSPPRITKTHLQRGLVNLYICLFAPVTRASFEMLICKSVCDDCDAAFLAAGATHPTCEVCETVNAFDTSVACWQGDHVVAAVFASATLLAFVLILPIVLMQKVQFSQRRRDFSLEMKLCNLDKQFDDADKDRSGWLETAEVRALLRFVSFAIDSVSDLRSLERELKRIDTEVC